MKDRPKWLRSMMGTLAAWWAFWICFAVLLVAGIGVADAILPGDGLALRPGSLLAILILTTLALLPGSFVFTLF